MASNVMCTPTRPFRQQSTNKRSLFIKLTKHSKMLTALIVTQLIKLVTGNYCEFGLCNDEIQYCCGKNKCCSKSSNLWFFWAGILVVVFILVIVAICNRKPQQDLNGYSEVPQNERIEQAT